MDGVAGKASCNTIEATAVFQPYALPSALQVLSLSSTSLSLRSVLAPYLIRVLKHEKNAVIPNLTRPQPAKSHNSVFSPPTRLALVSHTDNSRVQVVFNTAGRSRPPETSRSFMRYAGCQHPLRTRHLKARCRHCYVSLRLREATRHQAVHSAGC